MQAAPVLRMIFVPACHPSEQALEVVAKHHATAFLDEYFTIIPSLYLYHMPYILNCCSCTAFGAAAAPCSQDHFITAVFWHNRAP